MSLHLLKLNLAELCWRSTPPLQKKKGDKYEPNCTGAVFAETEEAGIGVVVKTLEVT